MRSGTDIRSINATSVCSVLDSSSPGIPGTAFAQGTENGVKDELFRDFVMKCYKKDDHEGNKAYQGSVQAPGWKYRRSYV